MRVMHLSLADFRNYASAEVGFCEGHNLVLGRNGQGKTNLVEAIAYFASLRSHRVSSESALIRKGAESAISRLRIAVGAREASLETRINRSGPNRAQVNGSTVRPRELTRWFSAVVFAPEDLLIVRGEPSLRRRFLDEAIAARNPALIGVLSDYDRVVRQRTALLKSARSSGTHRSNPEGVDAALGVWDDQLVSFGSRIITERRRLVADMGEPLARAYGALVVDDHSPELSMHETIDSDVSRETIGRGATERAPDSDAFESDGDVSRETLEQQFYSAIRAAREQELDRGVTLIGPHRDDLLLTLNDLPVKGYASHGESWSFSLALRLALAAILRAESPPVIR